jgi:hypothetical protein
MGLAKALARGCFTPEQVWRIARLAAARPRNLCAKCFDVSARASFFLALPMHRSGAEVRMPVQPEPNTYRVEVSGWDSSENFFVEKTALNWGRDAQRQVILKSKLREGCVLFVRLLQSAAMLNNFPMAYQAACIEQAPGDGGTLVVLAPLQPRSAGQLDSAMASSATDPLVGSGTQAA